MTQKELLVTDGLTGCAQSLWMIELAVVIASVVEQATRKGSAETAIAFCENFPSSCNCHVTEQ
jgi:hypothetical protein